MMQGYDKIQVSFSDNFSTYHLHLLGTLVLLLVHVSIQPLQKIKSRAQVNFHIKHQKEGKMLLTVMDVGADLLGVSGTAVDL